MQANHQPKSHFSKSVLRRFLDSSSSGGLVLMAAAALALIVANSPLGGVYANLLHSYVGGLSVLHWVNDALMAVFFLMVGLEIKREVLDGELSTWSRRVLPGAAALGGMIGPALIYLAFNQGNLGHPNGWAIPAATDIAFALGVLSLLGSRVPTSLKIFLTALAIIDDLGAVVIIALFYTSGLQPLMLAAAAAVTIALFLLNKRGVTSLIPYIVLGGVLWFLVLQSGVHATLAGVVLALTIPLKRSKAAPDDASSPLHKLEHGIAPWVTFVILPIFGFANAGVSLAGVSANDLTQPVPLGIAAGLFLGKQVGIFAMAALVIRMGWAELPKYASWMQLYGISLLCGIGFTMSLFIGLLAFPESIELQSGLKIGVLCGSILSGVLGYLLLRGSRPRLPAED
ncbi:Na+/H+ antiporter NhaA [Sphingobium yanoikuyae]|uniref:Na+/H+ antiporter NhaA n=1 Tax=Sphingobium yanoikuyae TaxID=13690 RepID=UPI00084657F7|nr:Na+/H+ antiporter NhaA [Sphingobium yanoikuyae]